MANGIANYIFETEKTDARIRKSVQDDFKTQDEDFLFKEHLDEDEIDSIEDLTSTDFFEEFDNQSRCSEKSNQEAAYEKIKRKIPSRKKLSIKKKTTLKGKAKKKPNLKEKATVVAPGENQKFDNIFKYQEEKCFPTLFPKGTGNC